MTPIITYSHKIEFRKRLSGKVKEVGLYDETYTYDIATIISSLRKHVHPNPDYIHVMAITTKQHSHHIHFYLDISSGLIVPGLLSKKVIIDFHSRSIVEEKIMESMREFVNQD